MSFFVIFSLLQMVSNFHMYTNLLYVSDADDNTFCKFREFWRTLRYLISQELDV